MCPNAHKCTYKKTQQGKNNTCKNDGKLGKQQQQKSDEKSSQIRIVIFQAWHWHDPHDATAPCVP
jgi:hypothetical protein